MPLIVIQTFCLLMLAALAAYGMLTDSIEVLLALVPVAAGGLGYSVFDRVRSEVEAAMSPPPEDEKTAS